MSKLFESVEAKKENKSEPDWETTHAVGEECPF
jgi:hypothetical protein